MARIVSLVVLVAILAVTGVLFFQVMANFLLPLFLALLLVVMFGPLNNWFRRRCHGHDRLAALLTTGSILLMVLIPLMVLMFEAGREAGHCTTWPFVVRPRPLRRRPEGRRPTPNRPTWRRCPIGLPTT